MNKTVLWVLGVVIVAGGWYLYSSNGSGSQFLNSDSSALPVADANSGTSASNAVPADASADPSLSVATPASATVKYGDSGFSPASITVKRGSTVTFTSVAGDMWVAANPHPSHEGYNGTTKAQHCPRAADAPDVSFDQCAAGKSYSFIFQKTGTWGYHDHKNASASGVVNVIE